MIAWCQVRVFATTIAGVAAGNIVAQHTNIAPFVPVGILGVTGWLGGNLLNRYLATR